MASSDTGSELMPWTHQSKEDSLMVRGSLNTLTGGPSWCTEHPCSYFLAPECTVKTDMLGHCRIPSLAPLQVAIVIGKASESPKNKTAVSTDIVC